MGEGMRYGVILPGGSAPEQVEQAVLAERAGWDGVFVWEAAYGVDAWSLLSAMAVATERVRLGTLLTPLPWRRPWKVASQVATLDQLSAGRAILSVGVGAPPEGMPDAGEVMDLRTRAEMMDEGIDLIRTLWTGGQAYRGRHYTYQAPRPELLPVQERIPIWVVGVWPRPKSMRRVLRCDGIIPQYQLDDREADPADARAVHAWLNEHGAAPGLDIIAEGETPASDPAAAAAQVRPWAAAGCTWWLETRWQLDGTADARTHEVRTRITAGPPKPTHTT